MTTAIILTLTALAFLAMAGAVACLVWLGAVMGGAVMRLVFGMRNPDTAPDLAEVDRLIRDTRRLAGLPPLR